MRRSPKVSDLYEDRFAGFILSADYCAEHEWGIKDVLNLFEVKDLDGIEGRRLYIENPDCVNLFEHNGIYNLIVQNDWNIKYTIESIKNNNKRSEFYFIDDPTGAWSRSGFIIRSKNKEKMTELHNTFLNNGVAIWLGGGGLFKNAGLCIAIIDKVKAEDKQVMLDSDLDQKKLISEAQKTGIQQKIDQRVAEDKKMIEVETGSPCYITKHSYYALSPSWKNGIKSKYKVKFWLNPMNQTQYNSGWFSVEQLEEWLEGKGPVVKQ